ncbi:Retrovirus-related Pol polyprotein from transposon TNT 1-94 [Apostasia shenzhenica]|uniref:Retrovirus-related Pol polyprotein from transposon TNT 1-94 n=1 Tax=Apostasia shenzhenica TaxID=1088818 RepID=A0A2I0BHC5_9ASPA|nr:Retrovirus-related Pol polyprotein from transposon TNT 1-94 [Apostasia shenzhenica]
MWDLALEQLDMMTIFLHDNLDEEIYMIQPEDFVQQDSEKMICKLKKSLYGLKQAPCQWYKRFDIFMITHDYIKSKFDSCVYFHFLSDDSIILLMLYIDDMLIACKHMHEISELKKVLSSKFEIKDLGNAKKILGMKIHRDRHEGKLWLTKKSYIEKVLAKFNMKNTKAVSKSLAYQFKLFS